MHITDLTDDELLASFARVRGDGHRATAQCLVHLAEIEERRLHLKAACPSLFDFCVRKLLLSNGAAQRRINGARLVRRHPKILPRIASGELPLSNLDLVHKLLTEETLEEILDEASGKTYREVERIVARRAPKIDVPERITHVPVAPVQSMLGEPSPSRADELSSAGGGRDTSTGAFMCNDADRGVAKPLSEDRYAVQLTISAAAHEKLERARDLLRHQHPRGELSVVFEKALEALLEQLEKTRLGHAKRPLRHKRPAKEGRISRSTRREVFARDGIQCTFVSDDGERCPERGFLELDHVMPHATGGSGEPDNVRVRCRAHNQLHAEEAFGKAHVARAIDFRRRKSICERAMKQTEGREANRRERDHEHEPASEREHAAVRGLAAMGFNKNEARRAVRAVLDRTRSRGGAPPLESLLRDALGVLT